MKKRIPNLESDEAAEAFLNQDLSGYLTKENLFPMEFEFLPKDHKISLRFPKDFLEAIKEAASKQGISYQKYIRRAVEQTLRLEKNA